MTAAPPAFRSSPPRSPFLRRRGAAALEVAFVAPLAFLFTLGTIVAGFGTFRHQQVTYLAREGSRWASVRGPEYQTQTETAPPTAADVHAAAVLPKCVGLKRESLRSELTWGPDGRTVRFRVSYDWVPESFLKPMTLTAVSEMPVTN